jgi:hypothetical protein
MNRSEGPENEMVTGAYRNIIGREPDEAGQQYWSSRAKDMPTEDFYRAFSEAARAQEPQEFSGTKFGSAYNDAEAQRARWQSQMDKWLTDAYQSTLGRAPDEAGREYWAGRLTGGENPQLTQTAFLNAAQAELQPGRDAAFSRQFSPTVLIEQLRTNMAGRQEAGGPAAFINALGPDWTAQGEDGKTYPRPRS